MFAVTVQFEIVPEKYQDFLPLMQANARASVEQEPGCHIFDVCIDPNRPNAIFLYELYVDEAAFKKHMEQPHYKTFNDESLGMIASKTVTTFAQVMR